MTLAQAAAELGIKHVPPSRPLTLSAAHAADDGLCFGVSYPTGLKICSELAPHFAHRCHDCQREQESVTRNVTAGLAPCGWRLSEVTP